jgi:hypothetical protein
MIHLDFVRGSTLLDLLALRSSVRRQRDQLAAALRCLRAEIRGWNQHRRVQQTRRQAVPAELARLWDDLAGREAELAESLAGAEAALTDYGARIGSALSTRRRAG